MKYTLKLMSMILIIVTLVSSISMNASAINTTYTFSSSYKNSTYYSNLINVKLTGNYHTDLVNICASQVGYKESNSSSNLSGTYQGSNNYTEYGRMANNINGEWCAYFVSFAAEMAGIPTNTIKHTGLAAADYFGVIWHERKDYSPVPGDLIFFDYAPYNYALPSSAHGDHVGIVERVDSHYVYTIEGNSSNKVSRCTYSKNNVSIKGYGSYNEKEKEPYNDTVEVLRDNLGLKASLALNQKVNAYDNYAGKYVGRIFESDVFSVTDIKYVSGDFWARVDCPWTSNGKSFTKTVYIPLKEIVPDINYSIWRARALSRITTYKHSDCSNSTTGYIDKNDIVYIVCESGGNMLALYPLAGGGYKLGWF